MVQDQQIFLLVIGAIGSAIAAIAGVITVILQIYAFLKDRSEIKVTYSFNMKAMNAEPIYKNGEDVILISAINKGRRPVKMAGAAMKPWGRGKTNLYLTDSFNANKITLIDESNPRVDYTVRKDNITEPMIWYVCTWDETGRYFRKFTRWYWPLLWLYHFIRSSMQPDKYPLMHKKKKV